jgi:hypothetical protein
MGLAFFPDGASFSVWAPHARGAILEVAEELITNDSSSDSSNNNNNNNNGNNGSGAEPVVAKGVKQYPLVRMGDNWATVLQPGQIKSGQAYRLVLTVLDESRPIESSGGNITGAALAQQSRPPPVQTDFIPSAGSQAWDMSAFQQQQQQTGYSAYNPYGGGGGGGGNPYGASSNPYASAPVVTVQYAEMKVKRRWVGASQTAASAAALGSMRTSTSNSSTSNSSPAPAGV